MGPRNFLTLLLHENLKKPRTFCDRDAIAVGGPVPSFPPTVANDRLLTLAANCSPSPRILLNDRAEFYPRCVIIGERSLPSQIVARAE